MDARSRPALRAVESIVVPDREHGRVLVLRDTQGITDAQAVLPPILVPVVSRFTGNLTCEEVAREASAELGAPIPVEVVVHLASQLEGGLFLDGPVFRTARERVEREFVESAVRPATHAGAAYHGERGALEQYIEQSCLARAGDRPAATDSSPASGMVALIAPHIDPWRGAVGYGHAYRALGSAISSEVDTFIVFGTSHAPMREPFALCRKAFDTPLGAVQADTASLDTLAAAADGFDPYADQFNHKREHSLEFQVVFLKHVLRGREFRIVPILAGLGAAQASGEDPDGDARVARFVDGLRAVVESRPGRVVVVARRPAFWRRQSLWGRAEGWPRESRPHFPGACLRARCPRLLGPRERRSRREARVRPRPHLVAASFGERKPRAGPLASLRANHRRRRRIHREPRRARVFRVSDARTTSDPELDRAGRAVVCTWSVRPPGGALT